MDYSYDTLKRVSAEKLMDSDGVTVLSTIAYTYNDKWELETIGDSSSSYAYTYNDAGQVTSVDNSGTPSMPDVVLSQGYDGFGNRSSLVATVGSSTVFTNDYTYSALGQMTQVTQSGSGITSKEADFTYNDDGQFETMTLLAGGTGVASAAWGYDHDGRLTSLAYTRTSDSSTINSYGFTYDANAWITQMTNADGTTNYTYDHDGQVSGASGSALTTSQSFSYDANGNRTSTSLSTGANNELSSDGTYDYAYDADGNLITKTTIATGATENFSWDYRNRLTDITYKTSGGTTTEHIHFTYDVFNRRIGQQIDSDGDGTYDSTERYVYDGNSLVLVLNSSGSVTHTFLNGPGANQVLADDAGSSNVTWMLADNQGSVRDVVNDSGSSADHIQYDTYGNILTQSSPSNQPRFAYAGMQLDKATGLYYDNARYYDSSQGRFISTDPTGFAGGNTNLYGYVNNDPANLIDPTGLAPYSHGNGGGGPNGGPGNNGGHQYTDVQSAASYWENYLFAFYGLEDYGSAGDVTPSARVQYWTDASRTVAIGAAAAATGGLAADGLAAYVGAETAGTFLGTVTIGGVNGAVTFGTANILTQSYSDQPFSPSSLYGSANTGAGSGMAFSGVLYGLNTLMAPTSPTLTPSPSPSSAVANAAENTTANIVERDPLDWSRTNWQGQTAYDHVQAHGIDNLAKPLQGIFSNDPVLTTEQAWSQAQLQGIQPQIQGNGNSLYQVPMGGPVGWQGGFNGSGAPLTNVNIFVNPANQVVTSFPK